MCQARTSTLGQIPAAGTPFWLICMSMPLLLFSFLFLCPKNAYELISFIVLRVGVCVASIELGPHGRGLNAHIPVPTTRPGKKQRLFSVSLSLC